MKRKGLISLAMVGVMAVSMLTGCGSSKTTTTETTAAGTTAAATEATTQAAGKDIKVGFAIKTQDSPYFVALVNAVKELGAAEGWNVTVLDANGDTTKEAENMETFIAQGMDMIFLDSVEPDACIPSINAAADAGIGVINLDSGVGEGAKDITTVYSEIGRAHV